MRLILTAVLCCWALTANANVFDETDWRRLGDLSLKVANLMEDVGNIQKGAPGAARYCLDYVSFDLLWLSGNLETG